ncbi:alpha/beta hydrolase [Rhodococcus sp. NPDC055024]
MFYHEFSTYDELNVEYAIDRSVDDFDGYLLSYAQRSAATRNRLVYREISYGPTVAETFDFFESEPAPAVAAPVMVFIHGGFWYLGSKSDFSFVADGLSTAGFAVAVEDYELCPNVSMTEIVRQHRALVAHLHRNAADLGIDPTRIYVVGHSAGGHAAASVMETDWSYYGLPEKAVAGAIAISGLFDLRPLPFTFVAPHLQFTGQETQDLSPILNIPATMPPVLVTHGSYETAEFCRQSVDYANALTGAGLPAQYLELPRNHYDILDDLAEREGALCSRLVQWATEH